MRRLWLMLCLGWLSFAAHAADLNIDLGHGVQTYHTSQLLDRHDARQIDIPADVSYKKPMRYRAVPLLALLDGLGPDDHLQFIASDGFTAEIPASLLLDRRGSQAWLAIEPANQPWPALAAGKPSAGPFYVVWTRPEAAHVGQEQWPYELATIRKLADVSARFPAMRPNSALPADSPARRGFAVFQRTCMACHKLNGGGDSQKGPDLNIPHNPTEYIRADLLRAFVRDPKSLRWWPAAQMPGFSRDQLSDADLNDLLAYLKHMAGRKAVP